jgi:hypothetical protein
MLLWFFVSAHFTRQDSDQYEEYKWAREPQQLVVNRSLVGDLVYSSSLRDGFQ